MEAFKLGLDLAASTPLGPCLEVNPGRGQEAISQVQVVMHRHAKLLHSGVANGHEVVIDMAHFGCTLRSWGVELSLREKECREMVQPVAPWPDGLSVLR